MPGYTPTGPFINGSAPGVSATLLNNIENWIQQLEGDSGAVVLNGSTSGTATLYQVVQGTYKYVICAQNNFRNGGGSAQTITFPVAFNGPVYIRSTNTNTFSVLSVGAAQSCGVITGLAVGGGTFTSATSMGGFSFADCIHAIDTLSFQSGAASAHTGLIIIEGS